MNILPTDFSNFPEDDKVLWLQIQSWFKSLGSKYGVSDADFPELYHFELINNHSKYALWKSLLLKFNAFQFNLLVAEYAITYNKNQRKKNLEEEDRSGHYYFLGYLKLNESYGRALIRPETIRDKIEELFQPVEIGFDTHKSFSKKYFVIAANKKDFKKKMEDKPQVLEVLNNYPNTYLEFNDNECLFMNFKAVSYENLVYTINLGVLLDQTLNERAI